MSNDHLEEMAAMRRAEGAEDTRTPAEAALLVFLLDPLVGQVLARLDPKGVNQAWLALMGVCEQCGTSGVDTDYKGADGRSVCDYCRGGEPQC